MRPHKLLLCAALCAAAALHGCGYSATRLLPSKYRTVYVQPLENKIAITQEVNEQFGFQTNLPDIEEKITQGVISHFLFDGNLRVTTKPEEADLKIEGKLTNFYRQPVRRNQDNNVEEYRLNLTGEVILRDKEGQVLWEEPNMIGDVTYFVTGSSARSESSAVDDLIVDFSKRVVERVVENW